MEYLKKILINGNEIEVDSSLTILQACEQHGIEIPRFCYHERLSIAGNCRMCLVEVVGGPPKPAASCALQVKDLRPGRNGEMPEVKTNSQMVRQAREGVMEFLLINHPLDCPICDQGGECDLQDQAMAYGLDFSRYQESKRSVEDINLGPLVKTSMTRCISCTRCVRFMTEVAGVSELGQTGRGEDSEIISYLGASLSSELQGNLIDLCPVGALTSKPYAFTARPWELDKTETIDVMDSLGSNIRIDSKGSRIMRITPINNDEINEEWISDKTRFIWDGLSRQRLDSPYIRVKGKLVKCSWNDAFSTIKDALKGKKIGAICGELQPLESIYALRNLVGSLSGKTECRIDGALFSNKNRCDYVGNGSFADIDKCRTITIIGCDPNFQSPVLNSRIRRAWLRGAEINYFGDKCELSFETISNENSLEKLDKFLIKKDKIVNEGDHLIILGRENISGESGKILLEKVKNFCINKNSKFIIIHSGANSVGAIDVGFTSDIGYQKLLESSDVIFNLGFDEMELPKKDKLLIYQGSHGDVGAANADVILPGAAYTEESGIFVNSEGRPQMSNRVIFPPGDAKENWAVIRALSSELGIDLNFNNLVDLRNEIYKEYGFLGETNNLKENQIKSDLDISKFQLKGEIKAVVTKSYFFTNPIARASETMAELDKLKATKQKKNVISV